MRRRAVDLLRLRGATAGVSILVVGGVIVFTLWQLHPSLLLANTTTSGGDTGAHVALPWYLEHHLLPHGRLTGWSPWWYDGYPQFTFYFPLPALFVAALNLVAPYNVAFKLVTVAGSLLLPVGAYVLGRGAGMRRPGPACLAAATLPFLFDQSFTIYGGNLASTLAGEYGFSLSLAISLIFLGVVANGLQTGRRRALAAVLLALAALCHFVPAFWAGVGAAVLVAMRLDRHRLRWVLPVAVVAVALTGFWLIPFYAGLPYTISLGFQRLTGYLHALFPEELLWAVALAAVGSVISVVRRRRLGTFLVIMAGLSVAMLVFDPAGKLYNARFLPLWILCVYLLAGVAAAELGVLAGELWARRRTGWRGRQDLRQAAVAAVGLVGEQAVERLAAHPEASRAVSVALPVLARDRRDLGEDPTEWAAREREVARTALALDPPLALAYELKEALGAAATVAREHPGLAEACVDRWAALAEGSGLAAFARLGRRVRRWRAEAVAYAAAGHDLRRFGRALPTAAVATPVAAWLLAAGVVAAPLGLIWTPVAVPKSFLPSWIHWNYTGYQGKAAWPEYRSLITTMSRVGHQHGCGRAMWEYGPELNQLGTPMALMLLPYWTHGCVDSMEGLLFESSATTPYHFLNQAELSSQPSEAMRGLPYSSLDVPAGIRHLQLLGVRYYMAFSPAAESEANRDPALTLVARSGPWATTVNNRSVDRTWNIYLVHDAPRVVPLTTQPVVLTGEARTSTGWLHAVLPWYTHPRRWGVMPAENGPPSWARVPAGDPSPPAIRVPPTTVSHVVHGDNRVSFDVTRVGTPVLVKTSYFPNWQASGARGPWRVAPNLMVVVPTAHHVSLHYGRTAADWAGIAVSLAGVAGTVWLGVAGRIPMPPPRRFRRARPAVPEAEDRERELVRAER